VYDIINGERHRVEAQLDDGRPLKGVHNVLRAIREDIDLIAADGRSVIAVIDEDAIRGQLKLPASADESRVIQAILSGSRAPEHVFVVLLHRNMESILEAAAACEPTLDPSRLNRAVRQKDLLERDTILVALSRERERRVRECILDRMPSMKKLVDTVITCVHGDRIASAITHPPSTAITQELKGKRARRPPRKRERR
jgi:hypothetical protein